MRYMLLIYSREDPREDRNPDAAASQAWSQEMQQVAASHRAVMDEASRQGVFRAADPLAVVSTATTVRKENGSILVTDGPFAETKEQLAGYYILECRDLDEALEWAAKIPTGCQGSPGCVEVRPIREMP